MNEISEEARLKRRQYIIENSAELRELKRQLQTAHNRRVLETKIALERTQRLQEKTWNNQAIDAERRVNEGEERRLQLIETARREEARKHAETLLQHVLERERNMDRERDKAAFEARLLQEKILQEQIEERRREEERKLEKETVRLQQEAWLTLKQKLKEEEEKREKMIEKELQERVAYQHAASDEQIAARRQRHMDAMEERKNMICAHLTELESIRRSKEELKMNLMCAERLEKERKQEEFNQRETLLRREAAVQQYDEILNHKKLEKDLARKLDSKFAEEVARRVRAEELTVKEEEKEKRRVRTAIRKDNRLLANMKTYRELSEKDEELTALEQVKECEEERLRVIEEERLSLLSAFDQPTLSYLPRNCLSETDYINLQSITLCRPSSTPENCPKNNIN